MESRVSLFLMCVCVCVCVWCVCVWCVIVVIVCRNSEDKDKVWTFGSGPRNCIGHLLSSGILKVRSYNVYCILVILLFIT